PLAKEAAAASIAICCRQLAPLIYAGGSGGVSTFLSWLAARQCPTDAVGTRLLVRSELRVVALGCDNVVGGLADVAEALDDFVGSVDCLLADAAGSAALEQEGTPNRAKTTPAPAPSTGAPIPASIQPANQLDQCLSGVLQALPAVVSHCQQTLRYLEILLGGSQLEIITVGVKCQHEMQRLDLDLDCLPVSKLFDSSIEPSRACLRRLKIDAGSRLRQSGGARHQRSESASAALNHFNNDIFLTFYLIRAGQ
uniref:TFCD_C domain-containing protein n=1 Tax=Macrostomum lignano TaxID=282301 RepID=A0A1I8FGK3_9PLAT